MYSFSNFYYGLPISKKARCQQTIALFCDEFVICTYRKSCYTVHRFLFLEQLFSVIHY